MGSGFRALKSRNYRLWTYGALVSNVGTWMQRTAQDWLVLTGLTHHSGLAVGITTGLQFAPLLLFSAHAGVLADRLPKRQVLLCTQTVMGLLALLVGVLVITHQVQLWEVFVCAFALGCASAVDNPTRQAFVSEVVPRTDVASAVSLNSAGRNLARLVGPGVAGLIIQAWGSGPAFIINGASFIAVLIAVFRMNPREFNRVERVRRGPGQVREGLRYARGRPDILLVFVCTGLVATFALNFPITNALMATEAFHRDAGAYGLLGSVQAIGSLSGALIGARRERPRLGLIIGGATGLGVCMVVGSMMPAYPLYAVLLIPIGLSSITFLNSCNTSVQLATAPEMRGRVLSFYVALQQGTTPIGAPIIGWLGGEFGARWSVLSGAFAALGTALLAVVVLHRRPDIKHRYEQMIAAEQEREVSVGAR